MRLPTAAEWENFGPPLVAVACGLLLALLLWRQR